MSQRTYKSVAKPRGQRGTHISEINGEQRTAFLWLPDGTPPETQSEVIVALQRALQQGREDRSGEILGDAGLNRAVVAVGNHSFEPAFGHLDWGGCTCTRHPSGPYASWQAHLAYEVLQAAAKL